MDYKFAEIDVNNIETGKSQVRNRKVEEDLDVLITSIRKFGLLEPVTVFKKDENKYVLIAGQRRLLAMKKLDWKKIPVTIIDRPEDAVGEKKISFVENVVRTDMVNQDLVDACTIFYKKYGSLKVVAEELGIPAKNAAKYIKYDRLPDSVKEEIEKQNVNLNVALKAADALTWDSGIVEEEDKVKELALEMQKLSNPQRNQVVKVGQTDPSKPIDEIILKAKSRTGKKITIVVLDEDYLRIGNYKDKEGTDSIEDATYDLTKKGLSSSGY